VTPIPYKVPGYESEIVMAAGTFIEGSTIELSADGPLREPYIAYLQGGLNYAHTKIVLQNILNNSLF
jgi:cystathionine beta-lyase family protein involved in aluminum resistance